MRQHEMHALRNVLQTITGYIELGMKEKALKSIHDADVLIGRDYNGSEVVAWTGSPATFELADGVRLLIETAAHVDTSSGPQQALFVELQSSSNRMGLTLPCGVCHAVAQLMLSYCDLLELQTKNKT